MNNKTLPPRERLLETASELFYQQGTGLGVNDIFEKSGVSRATFYRYFPSKEHLILASLELRAARWRDWFQSEVERQAEHPKQRLIAIFDVLGQHFEDSQFRGCTAINFAIENADPKSEIHQIAFDHKKQVETFLLNLAKAAGAKPLEAQALAEEISLLMNGATIMAHLSQNIIPAQQAKRAAQIIVDHAFREIN